MTFIDGSEVRFIQLLLSMEIVIGNVLDGYYDRLTTCFTSWEANLMQND